MLRVVLVSDPLKSTMPLGGSPTDDAAYMAWKDAFLQAADDLIFTRYWHEALDHVLGIVELRAVFDEQLWQALQGPLPLFGTRDVVNYQHRLRFLAIALRDHRKEVVAAAERIRDQHLGNAAGS